MFSKLVNARFIVAIAVVFMLINALVFVIVGVIHCIHGYVNFLEIGFLPSDGQRPGLLLLEGLDAFMIALIYLIVGLGMGRLFIFDNVDAAKLPAWLNITDLKSLKVITLETIMITLVVLWITYLMKHPPSGWFDLIFPISILIYSISVFLIRRRE